MEPVEDSEGALSTLAMLHQWPVKETLTHTDCLMVSTGARVAAEKTLTDEDADA